MMKFRLPVLLLFFMMTFLKCSKEERIPESAIMARIGDRVITINEFIERAEYTIRPPYAKQNSYIHKKIVLNSLIAEKLMAIEAGDSSALMQSEKFNLFVQGRKEQVMRQLFFQKNMYDKVKYDDKELDDLFRMAGRTYDIQFVASTDPRLSNYLKQEVIDKHGDFEEAVLTYTGGDSLPRRSVTFDFNEIEQVRRALYENDVKKGEVIGPIHVEDQDLFIKVLGWRESVAVSPQDIQNRWQDVKRHISFKYAGEMYNDFVHKLMRGKRVDFDRNTFIALVNVLGPVYFPKADEKEAQLQQSMWGRSVSEEGLPDSLKQQLQALEDRPLLTCDGETWTVADFGRELVLHPLQFRKRNYPKNEFGSQLRLAIVDMIRDKYITEAAYKQKLDQTFLVKSKEQMWRDAYAATYLRDSKLDQSGLLQKFPKEYLSILKKELNPFVDSLQAKYSDIIEINTDALEEVELSRIDMFAMYANQPYPIIVPGFPVLTTDIQLDYGRKLIEE